MGAVPVDTERDALIGQLLCRMLFVVRGRTYSQPRRMRGSRGAGPCYERDVCSSCHLISPLLFICTQLRSLHCRQTYKHTIAIPSDIRIWPLPHSHTRLTDSAGRPPSEPTFRARAPETIELGTTHSPEARYGPQLSFHTPKFLITAAERFGGLLCGPKRTSESSIMP
jgi:hypothetical protein